MNTIGKLIASSRKNKQLTQEQLAELSKVNLRTIQRIENKENIPRGNTLKLICDALEIEVPSIEDSNKKIGKTYIEISFHYVFLIIANLALNGTIGWMTLDSNANSNTVFAGFLLSFFIPYFIANATPNMSKNERYIKFGTGAILYVISSIIIIGFYVAFKSSLLPCLSIYLITLFNAEKLIKNK